MTATTQDIQTKVESFQVDGGNNETGVFANIGNFQEAQRMAKALGSSSLVPAQYQGDANIGNAIIALSMAQRIGADPMMVMQNLYVVHGKPAWSAQFVISAVNSCGRFSPLRFDMSGEGDSRSCIAWVKEKGNGARLEGPPSSIVMAKAEGWFQKNGSKWKTMPEVMLRYRAASFFGRLYAPDILMGMQTQEEAHDIIDVNQETGEVLHIDSVRPTSDSRTTEVAEKVAKKREEVVI